jgi:hypothetical protein
MNNIAKASWISPASSALLIKFGKLFLQILEAISIVDEYIHDLEHARNEYVKMEDRLTERSNALKTDVFGI